MNPFLWSLKWAHCQRSLSVQNWPNCPQTVGSLLLRCKRSPSCLYVIMFFNYRTLKAKRDAYVSHLNRIYRNNLDKVNLFLLLDYMIALILLGSEIIYCLFTVCSICIFLRLKSRLFKVMPGLQMTLNQVLRLTVKSTPHLTSSLPLEDSQLFWVTLRFLVSHHHHYLCVSIK